MTPAAAYLRKSTDKQEMSLPAQRSAVIELAKARGYKIVREYVDAGVSGDDTENRHEFQRMIADGAKGLFKVVLCWDQDRFGRFDPLEAGKWIHPLRSAGVQLITVAQGPIDWTTFAGRILYAIQQESKHQYLHDLSRNINRGKMEAAKLGKWMSGDAPYGYVVGPDQRLVPVPGKAEVVTRIFKLYASGKTMRVISQILAEDGIPAPESEEWRPSAVQRIIGNRHYLGHTIYNRKSVGKYTAIVNGTIVPRTQPGTSNNDPSLWITVENTHPPLTTPTLFALAEKNRKANKQFSGPSSTFRVMFKSLLRCGWCGSRMQGMWTPAVNDTAYSCAKYMARNGCISNRTYQLGLWQRVQEILASQYLSPSGIAAMKKRIQERFEVPAPTVSIAALESQYAHAVAKVSKAEQRLPEVPPDMMGTLIDQIRTLRAKAVELEFQLKVAREPKRNKSGFISEWIEQEIELFKRLGSLGDKAPIEDISVMLRQAFESITVFSKKLPAGRSPKGMWMPNGVWVIEKVVPEIKIPDELH